jgi:nucleotide-binding universal stress UspA family protein
MHAIEIPPEFYDIPGNAALSADFNVDQVRAAAEAECLERLRSLIPKEAGEYCTVETTVSEGSAYRQILKLAAERATQLIVMGVRGHSALDLFVFGSNTEQVVRGATCPVITVPASPQAA